MSLPRIAFQNWLAERQHDCMALAREDGLTAQEIAADLRLAAWIELVADPFNPRAPAGFVTLDEVRQQQKLAQPNWAALGFGSQAEAEGRN